MPDPADGPAPIYRFGDFELDFERTELRREGTRVELQRKPLQLLMYLAQHRDRVVSNRDLLDQVWAGVTVSENALTSAVRDVRKALGDEGRSPRFIENLRAHGYRFTAEVQEVTVPGLESRQRTRARDIRSIAVLPLDNLSGDPEQDYIVAGMHDQLISSLARVGPELLVISRTSVIGIDRKGKTTPEIAAVLGVDGIIEGSVTLEGDQVLVSVQLIDARTDGHLWTKSYERPFGGMIALSREISRTVAAQVAIILTPERATLLAATPRTDSEALDLYLRGFQHNTRREFRRAAELFQAAIEADPSFARAYVSLAATYRNRMQREHMPPEEAQPRLRAALVRAIELDETLGTAHALLALSELEEDHDWSKAEQRLSRALEIEPYAAGVMTSFAYFLAAAGRHEEALVLADRAVAVDPISPFTHGQRLVTLFVARKFERAIEEGNRILESDPTNSFVRAQVGHSHARLGEDEAAHRSFVELRRAEGWDTDGMERAYLRGGLQASAAEMLAQRRNEGRMGSLALANIACLASEPEEALLELSRIPPDSAEELLIIGTWPGLDCVRSDPRFQELLRKINWPGLDD